MNICLRYRKLSITATTAASTGGQCLIVGENMSYGRWGSRVPLGNLFFTWVIRLGVRWRISSQRLANRLRAILGRRPLVVVNSSSLTVELRHWLDAGFNRLNIGGGPKNLTGFINLDFVAHPKVAREVRANILDLSFVPTACATQIHSNHVIEHLSQQQIRAQLNDYFRILRPGGLLTLRCPNSLGVVYALFFDPVCESDREEFLAIGYPVDEDFGNPADTWLHKDFYGVLHWLYGDAGNIENEHLSQLTPTRLAQLVSAIGFDILRVSEPEAINLVLVARKPEIVP